MIPNRLPKRFPNTWQRCAQVASGLVLLAAIMLAFENWGEFLVTADQRGQRLLDQQDYQAAAETFADPFRAATAQYRAGEFEQAASMFGGLPSAEASYNQANALVMQGKYQDAVGQYDRAIELRPDWQAAIANRELAAERAKRLDFEGGDMTGGEMGADGITFDDSASSSEQTETVEGEVQADDESLRAIWLRQVQTTPSEFLKAKFAYQRAMAAKGQESSDE